MREEEIHESILDMLEDKKERFETTEKKVEHNYPDVCLVHTLACVFSESQKRLVEEEEKGGDDDLSQSVYEGNRPADTFGAANSDMRTGLIKSIRGSGVYRNSLTTCKETDREYANATVIGETPLVPKGK